MDNKWLQDSEFLNSIDFLDKHYLKEVTNVMRVYAYKCPLKYMCFQWNAENRVVDIYVQDKRVGDVKIDANVAPHDVVTLIERQISKYFPQYHLILNETIDVDYSADEIANFIKTDPDFDVEQIFNMRKTVNKSESGIIERVWILDDKFKFVRIIDGKRQEELRVSTIPITEFLKSARKLKQEALQEHIEANSMLSCIYTPRPVEVNYTGEQLKNFIKINEDEGFVYPLQSTPLGMIYKLGRYVFFLSEADKPEIWPLIEDKIRQTVIDLGSD